MFCRSSYSAPFDVDLQDVDGVQPEVVERCAGGQDRDFVAATDIDDGGIRGNQVVEKEKMGRMR